MAINHTQTQRDPIRTAIEVHQQLSRHCCALFTASSMRLGHIPQDEMPAIAKGLQQSSAEIKGLISIYHHFNAKRPGDTTVITAYSSSFVCPPYPAKRVTGHPDQIQITHTATGRI